MHALILGGSGLISTGIVARLMDAGHQVTVFHRGERPPVAGVAAIRGDRNNAADLARARDAARYDAVIDMICFDGAQARLASDVFHGAVAQWVHCSTVDVYRKDLGRYPIREDAELGARPGFPYAVGKMAAEQALRSAAERGAFVLTIIRPAATYLDSAVAPFGSFRLMVERIRSGRAVILPGDGSSIWVSAHRDDVAVAFANALGNPRASNHAYHVAGEELLTWREYWRTIGRAMGIEPEFAYIPTDVLGRIAGDDALWCVENFQYDNIFDCSAARVDLGYVFRTTWEQGVAAFDLSPRPADEAENARYERVLQAWFAGAGREEPA